LVNRLGHLVRDAAEAEDAVQDALVEMLELGESDPLGEALENIENWGAWLAHVARNKVLDRFRRRRTRERHAETELAQADPAAVDGPDTEWTRGWLRAEILDALGQLPPAQREVFVLHELEGQSFEEISRLTGQNINTLLSRKRNAVRSLRQYLKEVYDELE
jgi:RNA polymerase sigma factor (sigma-70 family)